METHQPKGGMCAVCVFKNHDCSRLNFKAMPSISRKKQQNGVVIVKCSEFIKGGQ